MIFYFFMLSIANYSVADLQRVLGGYLGTYLKVDIPTGIF